MTDEQIEKIARRIAGKCYAAELTSHPPTTVLEHARIIAREIAPLIEAAIWCTRVDLTDEEQYAHDGIDCCPCAMDDEVRLRAALKPWVELIGKR